METEGSIHLHLFVADLDRSLRFYPEVFRLQGHLDRAIEEVERAGGRLVERGEHAPGKPYAYVFDRMGTPDQLLRNRGFECATVHVSRYRSSS